MDVFVYGTLTEPDRVDRLLDEYELGADAVLDGLRRVSGSYPTLAPGGTTTGRILHTPEIERLDEYEGVDRGLYVRVSVPGPTGDVAVYVGDPDALDVPVPISWPEAHSFHAQAERYLAENGVEIRFRDSRRPGAR